MKISSLLLAFPFHPLFTISHVTVEEHYALLVEHYGLFLYMLHTNELPLRHLFIHVVLHLVLSALLAPLERHCKPANYNQSFSSKRLDVETAC